MAINQEELPEAVGRYLIDTYGDGLRQKFALPIRSAARIVKHLNKTLKAEDAAGMVELLGIWSMVMEKLQDQLEVWFGKGLVQEKGALVASGSFLVDPHVSPESRRLFVNQLMMGIWKEEEVEDYDSESSVGA